MSDNAEYDQLISEKAQAEAKVESASNTKAILQEKVDRLKDAKRILDGCYDDFGDVNKNVKKILQDKYSWQGSNHDEFVNLGAYLIDYDKTYYNNIDTARDNVNSEIARLENEIYRQEGIIGELKALINSLWHKIENFFS